MGERIRRQTLDLPIETIEEILLNSPVKSLLRFKCVSKSWRSLISSKVFVTENLERSSTRPDLAHHNIILCSHLKTFAVSSLYKRTRWTPNSCSLKSLQDEPSKNLMMTSLDFYPMQSYDDPGLIMRCMGSCNGLIFMVRASNRRALVLWNPSTRHFRRLPCPYLAGDKNPYFDPPDLIYGLGYDELTDDYKIVCILLRWKSCKTEIYSCKGDSPSWRRMEDFPGVSVVNYFSKFVNRRLHWLVEKDGEGWDIVSLKLAEEKYEVVPWSEDISHNGISSAELEILGGYLCLITGDLAWAKNVWIMKNYGAIESWTKILTISDSAPAKPLWFAENGDVLVYSSPAAVVYDGETKKCKSRIDMVDTQVVESLIYVESLVSPFGDKDYGHHVGWNWRIQ